MLKIAISDNSCKRKVYKTNISLDKEIQTDHGIASSNYILTLQYFKYNWASIYVCFTFFPDVCISVKLTN